MTDSERTTTTSLWRSIVTYYLQDANFRGNEVLLKADMMSSLALRYRGAFHTVLVDRICKSDPSFIIMVY